MYQFDEKKTYSPSGSLEKEDRKKEIKGWTIEKTNQRARDEGIELSDEHHEVIKFLREFYVEFGWPKNTHELTRVLDEHFDAKGGNRYLHKLFPSGPVAQASNLAGLPRPDYAVDKSFGSTY